MFAMKHKVKNLKTTALVAVLYAVAIFSLTGCDSYFEPANAPTAPSPSVAVSAHVETPVATQEPEVVENLSVDSEPYEPTCVADEDAVVADVPEEKPAEPALESIEAVAAIKDMEPRRGSDTVIYRDKDHNPYDTAWNYGPKYDNYVKAVDELDMWDVLFNVDFYADTFPMLAMLYRYDAGLLLEHFQTVGIHEGRQGSAAFNVEAYIEHCDPALVGAFGDDYECYYFYWALNQETESDIDVSGDGCALQLCAEMTPTQAYELYAVNKYRAEVGADSVVFDSEIAAFACYRATVDMLEGYEAHDWMADHSRECDEFLDAVGSKRYTENTVHVSSPNGCTVTSGWALKYYDSPSHYEAMVNPDQAYFGCSNVYVFKGDGTETRTVEYDLYTPIATTPLNP